MQKKLNEMKCIMRVNILKFFKTLEERDVSKKKKKKFGIIVKYLYIDLAKIVYIGYTLVSQFKLLTLTSLLVEFKILLPLNYLSVIFNNLYKRNDFMHVLILKLIQIYLARVIYSMKYAFFSGFFLFVYFLSFSISLISPLITRQIMPSGLKLNKCKY